MNHDHCGERRRGATLAQGRAGKHTMEPPGSRHYAQVECAMPPGSCGASMQSDRSASSFLRPSRCAWELHVTSWRSAPSAADDARHLTSMSVTRAELQRRPRPLAGVVRASCTDRWMSKVDCSRRSSNNCRVSSLLYHVMKASMPVKRYFSASVISLSSES